MTRRSWWLFSSRKGLIILCVIVVLGMALWAGWSVDHRFGDAVVVALYQGFSCVFIVLAMALVRKLFEFRSVRILFDVLAVLTWAIIVPEARKFLETEMEKFFFGSWHTSRAYYCPKSRCPRNLSKTTKQTFGNIP